MLMIVCALLERWYALKSFMLSFFRAQTKYQIVLTKSDLVFPIDVARRAMQIEEVTLIRSSGTLFVKFSIV